MQALCLQDWCLTLTGALSTRHAVRCYQKPRTKAMHTACSPVLSAPINCTENGLLVCCQMPPKAAKASKPHNTAGFVFVHRMSQWRHRVWFMKPCMLAPQRRRSVLAMFVIVECQATEPEFMNQDFKIAHSNPNSTLRSTMQCDYNCRNGIEY